jgi:hypothetical protein
MNIVNIRKSIIPATPPSKGGETLSNRHIYITTLWLTAMPPILQMGGYVIDFNLPQSYLTIKKEASASRQPLKQEVIKVLNT